MAKVNGRAGQAGSTNAHAGRLDGVSLEATDPGTEAGWTPCSAVDSPTMEEKS